MSADPMREKIDGLRATILNLTLMFRQFRRGEWAFEPAGAKYFEDGLVAVGFDFAELIGMVDTKLLEDAVTLEEAEKLIVKLGTAKEPRQPAAVYVPEADRGTLADMAVPPEAASKIVIFPGVRRERHSGPGDAA